ncbi:MAG: tetratricopeptide repeat protein [Gemmatimonadota bacterium]|nr:MAG: tetratricopeptide repeat protein [Gemmatimonadota bacterium]
MARLKRLIVEIHRRSLWQVLLIYVGGAWVCYEIIDTITDRLALPEWLPVLAIILFLIGLPIVVATALVREDAADVTSAGPAAPSGSEAERVEASAAARHEAGRRTRFLTWRNAGLIFVFALALWGLVAAGWLVFAGGADETRAVAEERPSVAVLPLANRSGLREDEYFTDGIHDEILTQLSKISGLSVRGRTSAMRYRESPKNLREIGEELNARYLLEGGVLRAGETVRVNVQLIDAQRDEHLWAETYDRQLSIENLLAIQTEVARRIAEALEATLTPDEEDRLAAMPTASLEAYDYYLRGRHFWNQRSLAAFDSAVQYYSRAVLLDPDYARAYAGLAETYVLLPEYGGPSIPEILPVARAATERALLLDPDLAEAYTASAYIEDYFEWDREGAERDYLSAIELNPDYATAHQWYAELLTLTRRWDEALTEARRAVELDPLSFAPNLILGIAFTCAGRPADAIPAVERALEIVPDQELAIKWLAFAYVLKDDHAGAAPLFERFAEVTGSDPEAYRTYLAALSDPAEISAAVRALQAPDLFFPGLTAGGSAFLAHLGRFDEALAALEHAYEMRDPRLPWVSAHPFFEGLRSDPRFQDLLRRMNFPN